MVAVSEAPARARGRSGGTRQQAPSASAALAVQALQLLGRWQRVSSGHIALATGCACGYGAGVDLREIDELILDFLHNRFIHVPAVKVFVQQHAFAAQGRAERHGSLALLLRALAGHPAALPAHHVHQLLLALEGSITSIEEQH